MLDWFVPCPKLIWDRVTLLSSRAVDGYKNNSSCCNLCSVLFFFPSVSPALLLCYFQEKAWPCSKDISLTSFPRGRVTVTAWLVAAQSLFAIQAFEVSDADTESKWQLSCLLKACWFPYVANKRTPDTCLMEMEALIKHERDKRAEMKGRLKACECEVQFGQQITLGQEYLRISSQWKICVGKYKARICCASGCFEAPLFLFWVFERSQADVCCCWHVGTHAYLFG